MDATLAKKLQLKPGQALRALHAPEGFEADAPEAGGRDGPPASGRALRRRSRPRSGEPTIIAATRAIRPTSSQPIVPRSATSGRPLRIRRQPHHSWPLRTPAQRSDSAVGTST